MGVIFSTLWSRLMGDKEVKIVIVGLDNVGKTTILYKMQLGEVVVTQPTIGSHVGELVYNNVKFQAWDLGGQESLRPSWSIYFVNTQAVILVVDSSDRKRVDLVRQELFSMLENHDLQNAKILILANKQDVKNCMTAADLSKNLNLFKIKSHEWHIEPCCALTGDGLTRGMDWLVGKIK